MSTQTTSAVETILETADFALYYHPETKIIHHKFKREVGGPKLRLCLTSGTNAMRAHGATKWLSDDRENTAISKEDTEWCMNTWFPLTVSAGWKHWAIVLPEQLAGQLNMKLFVANYARQGVTAQYFTDADAAEAWLASCSG